MIGSRRSHAWRATPSPTGRPAEPQPKAPRPNRQGPLATRDKTAAPAAPIHPAAATGSWRREDCERVAHAERGRQAVAATGSWRREDCEGHGPREASRERRPQQARGAERTARTSPLAFMRSSSGRNRLVAPRGLREIDGEHPLIRQVAATGSWRREDCERMRFATAGALGSPQQARGAERTARSTASDTPANASSPQQARGAERTASRRGSSTGRTRRPGSWRREDCDSPPTSLHEPQAASGFEPRAGIVEPRGHSSSKLHFTH